MEYRVALISEPAGSFGFRFPVRNDYVFLKHSVGTEVLEDPPTSLVEPKPSVCVSVCHHLREGLLALGKIRADWASSMKLLSVTISSFFTGLSVACRATGSSRSTLVAFALHFHPSTRLPRHPPFWPSSIFRETPKMCAPRRPLPTSPLCETGMQHGVFPKVCSLGFD